MALPQLSPIINGAVAALQSWNAFAEEMAAFEGPNGEGFDLEKPIPNLAPQATIKQLEAKLTGAISLAHNLSSIESLTLVPDAIVNEVSNRISALRDATDKLNTQFSGLTRESPVVALDAAAMTAANEAGQQLNFPPIFLELYPTIQGLLLSLHQLRSIAGITDKNGLGLELSQLDAARSAQRRAYGELSKLRGVISASRREIETQASLAKTAAREIEGSKQKSATAADRAEEIKTKTEEILNAATEINANAEKVKGEVAAYAETFAKFKADLDGRNASLAKGQTEQERLLSEIAKIESEVDRLQSRSREVLGEATVTGLTESFAAEKKAAGWQLMWIQLLFFVSIALLFFSAGLILNAFPWLEGWFRPARWDPPGNAESWTIGIFYFGNFIAKAIFLMPALFLLAFAARRYGEVYEQKKLYTYKYTLASAITGFKIEAPNYAEVITAAAFQQLAANPKEEVEKTKEEKKEERGTILQRIVEPAVKRVLEQMGKLPKGPD